MAHIYSPDVGSGAPTVAERAFLPDRTLDGRFRPGSHGIGVQYPEHLVDCHEQLFVGTRNQEPEADRIGPDEFGVGRQPSSEGLPGGEPVFDTLPVVEGRHDRIGLQRHRTGDAVPDEHRRQSSASQDGW